MNTLLPQLLRGFALLIAIAAIIDPALTSARRTRPVVALVSGSGARDIELKDRVRESLDKTYTVVSAPLSSAAATVLVGDLVPDARTALAHPVVALSARANPSSLQLSHVQAPSSAMLGSRISVSSSLRASGASSATPQDIDVELALGGVIVARERHRLASDSAVGSELSFTPTKAGPVVLELRTFRPGAADTLRHDVLVNVRDTRWSVLFFDRRPSWMSTFVRRAVERDPRFAVTSRIVTSTNISRETGRAPFGLDAIAATEAFDAVVIGAPDVLTARDVDGVSTLLNRGASVLILADNPSDSRLYGIADFGGWRTIARRNPVGISSVGSASVAGDVIKLRAQSVGTPTRLPASASIIASISDSSSAANIANFRAVLWKQPVGAGQLFVSGAFDAWRYRDAQQSTFDATWRDLIDLAASARQRSFELNVSPTLVQPRTAVRLEVSLRDSASASPVRVEMRRIEDSTAPVRPIELERRNGGYIANLVAPLDSGRYEVVGTMGEDTVRIPFVVASHIARDADNDTDLLRAWATSGGGQLLSSDSLSALPDVVASLVRANPQEVEWHPMRSPWWILPFALALSAEWWIRRRRGLA